jgi:PPM family protein phosphatase
MDEPLQTESEHPQRQYERRYGMASIPGGRELNEDSCAVRDYSMRRTGRYLCFIAVADGMGGHSAGDVASRVAIETLQGMLDPANFESSEEFELRAASALQQAFSATNSRIHELGRASPGKKGMGTTLTCALADDENAFVAHVGDTRAYLVTEQGTRQITRDHSVVGKMVADGVLTEEQALAHGERNVITRAVGPMAEVETDILRVPVRAGEALFLCTDGLYTVVSRDEIARVVLPASDLQAACDNLVETAAARGSGDNITAVAWRMPAPEATAAGRGRTSRRGRRYGSWWAIALLALLVVAAGFALGWAVGSIWYTGKGKAAATTRKPAAVKRAEPVFAAGDVVRVKLDSGPLALRDAPDGTRVEGLEDGWELKVVSGPVKGAGRSWYQVEVIDTRYGGTVKQGYVSSEYLESP